MALSLRIASHSETGLVRKNNQDSGYASPQLLVVADGMGGAAAGDLASAVAIDSIRRIDKPIAGLIRDLKQRGLLDETLVVWATEFGRSPGSENSNGRDHHPFGFSVWMAGGADGPGGSIARLYAPAGAPFCDRQRGGGTEAAGGDASST